MKKPSSVLRSQLLMGMMILLIFRSAWAQPTTVYPDTVVIAQSDTVVTLQDSSALFQQQVSDSASYSVLYMEADTITDTLLMTIDKQVAARQQQALQAADTTAADSLRVPYFTGGFLNMKRGLYDEVDTSLTYFHQYQPIHHHNRLYSSLGNVGLAALNQVFSTQASTEYYTSVEAFDRYLFDQTSVRNFMTLQPFTELFYVMGSKKEQNLQVTFTRSLFKGFTFGMQYGLNNSPGPYKNSKSNDNRVIFTGRYQTPSKRYGVLVNYLHNKVEVQENGGIVYDSVFEQNLEVDRRVIAVNLDNASNLIKKSGFSVEQYFNLLNPEHPGDSNRRKIDAGSLIYNFNLERNHFIYEDPDRVSDYYIGHLTPLDSVSTFDSIYQLKISNTLQWTSLGYDETQDSRHFYLYFGLKHNMITQSFAYDSVDEHYQQLIPFGGLGINIGKSFYLNISARMVTGGYNGGDFEAEGNLTQYLGRKDRNVGQFSASLRLLNSTPQWYFQRYNSNYYRWNLDLNKEQHTIISGTYQFRQLTFGGRLHTTFNYTYLDDSIRPQQMASGESVLTLWGEGTLPWRSLGLNGRVVYQKTTQPNIIRLPEFTGTMDLYFQHTIFKKAATVKTGFQFTYFTRYFADAYMPELRLWHLQNDKEIGDYLYVDYYLTLVVKRARMFVKVAHVNGYLGNYNYFAAPHYPAQDAHLNFGVSWRFYD